MRILFVCDRSPFPGRDGITIPLANYLRGLDREHQTDLLLLQQKEQKTDVEEIHVGSGSEAYNYLYEGSIRKGSWIGRIVSELTLRRPSYSALFLDAPLPEEVKRRRYDIIWSTPGRIVDLTVRMIDEEQLSGKVHIAGINDLESLRQRRMSESRFPAGSWLRRSTRRVRNKFLVHSEMNVLKKCDLMLVQTAAEARWVREYENGLGERTLVISNGVDDTLFNISMQRTRKTIVFVGMMIGMYKSRMRWFLKEVWPKVRRENPGVRFSVIGRCDDIALLNRMRVDPAIDYCEFVEDKRRLYETKAILVAPIFKGYGFINKVAEAMAAGTLVVGDETAFNGITGFSDEVHGLVAGTADGFVRELNEALGSNDFLLPIRERARELASEEMRWSDRISEVETKLKTVLTEENNPVG